MAAEPQRPPKRSRRNRTRAPRPPRGRRRGSPGARPPKSPAADLAERLAQVGQGHREAGDAYACTVLNWVLESRWMVGLDHWTVAYPIPMPRLKGDHKNFLEPDAAIFCSMIAGDTVEQMQERTDRKQQSGSQEREPVSITNVEARMRQQPGRDAEQMREIRAALERRFGLLVPIDSVQFLVGDEPSNHEELRVAAGTSQLDIKARVVRRDQLDADQAPAAFGRTLFGAATLVTLRNGGEDRHLLRLLQMLLDGEWNSMKSDVLYSILQIAPESCRLLLEKSRQLMEANMANGTVVPTLGQLKAFHELADGFVRIVEEPTQLPFIRNLLEREQRKREREQRKLEREQRKLEREQRKLERELRAALVDGLLNLLAERSMQLTKTQERRLRGKPLAELPPLKLARTVKDAADFAKRAGLTNGRK